jgi:hypothetical protein
MLAHERDHGDEPEEALVIAPRPQPLRGEAQAIAEGDRDPHGLEEPLRVPVPAKDRLALPIDRPPRRVEGLTLEVSTADGEPLPSTRIRYGAQWPYLRTLAARGIPVAERCRLYEIRGTGHSWGSDERRDSGAGPAGPFVGAWIRNAKERLFEGRPEPLSPYGGFLDAQGRLRFEHAGGASTNVIGFLDDPALDSYAVASAPVTPELEQAWKEFAPIMPRGGLPLRPPVLENRLGGCSS